MLGVGVCINIKLQGHFPFHQKVRKLPGKVFWKTQSIFKPINFKRNPGNSAKKINQ